MVFTAPTQSFAERDAKNYILASTGGAKKRVSKSYLLQRHALLTMELKKLEKQLDDKENENIELEEELYKGEKSFKRRKVDLEDTNKELSRQNRELKEDATAINEKINKVKNDLDRETRVQWRHLYDTEGL